MIPKTMLAVLKEKPKSGVVIKKIPVPVLDKDEVLVKVKYASICGTDINIYDWNTWAQGHISPPAVIGHELVGEVIEINGKPENDLKVGDLVSSETHIFCQNCFQCEIGNKHICENMELFGIGRDGSFAEYTTIPLKTTWKNDPSIPLESMSVQEPLGNAVNVVTKADVKGKKILVMGLGPTGLCAGMVAKAYGAKEVVGVNRREYRRKLALKIGFDRALDELPESEYGTFDAVLEMSGNRIGIQIALDAARIAGKIIAFGIPKDKIDIDWGKYMINKELSIDSVFGRMIWDTWTDTTKLLVSGEVDLRKIITHRFKLSEFEKAMEVMKSGECGKVLLEP
ncbi:MAG TPA: alcohol dehydrogenase catalytic domain-containing protein [Candidatus Levybacteria bacterium]|nr:alcohol dehydrogenase catalytic domain-containing protein [Candidatus Levybacteria bacterium]